MPCCGLQEFRVKVPTRLTVAGVALLTSAFTALFLAGLFLVWLPVGRGILRCQKEFLAALWRETMRREGSAPARWSARLSGFLLPLSPAAAAFIYRRPEVPVLVAASSVVAGLAGLVALAL